MHIPVAFEGQQSLGVVLGSSVLDVQIPFLASHTMMTKLGFVIDLTCKTVYISALDVSFDLELRNGHLVAKIVCFHGCSTDFHRWKELMTRCVQDDNADPEVNWVSNNSAQDRIHPVTVCDRQPSDVEPAANMDVQLAHVGASFDALAAQDVQDDVQDGEARFEDPHLDDDAGGNGASTGADRRDQGHFGEVRPEDMRPSLLQEVREPARTVQSLPEVRPKVQVGSCQERLGSSCTAKLFSIFCLAASIFGNHSTSATADGAEGIHSQVQDQAYQQAWLPDIACGVQHEQSGQSDELGGRRGVPSGSNNLGRSGVPVSRLGFSGRCSLPVKDYWEVKDDLCIRHHVVQDRGCFIHKARLALWSSFD